MAATIRSREKKQVSATSLSPIVPAVSSIRLRFIPKHAVVWAGGSLPVCESSWPDCYLGLIERMCRRLCGREGKTFRTWAGVHLVAQSTWVAARGLRAWEASWRLVVERNAATGGLD